MRVSVVNEPATDEPQMPDRQELIARVAQLQKLNGGENKRPQRREPGPSATTILSSDRTGRRATRPPPKTRRFDQKSLHPASLRASGLFVTLCAFADSKTCDRLVASLLDSFNGLEAMLKMK